MDPAFFCCLFTMCVSYYSTVADLKQNFPKETLYFKYFTNVM